jgi:hypothetical protein
LNFLRSKKIVLINGDQVNDHQRQLSNEIDKLIDMIETVRPDVGKTIDTTQHQLLLKEASQLKVLNQKRVGIIQPPLATSPTTPKSNKQQRQKTPEKIVRGNVLRGEGGKEPLASSKSKDSIKPFPHRGQTLMNVNKNSNVTRNKFMHQQNLLNRQKNSKQRQQSHLTTPTSNSNTKALHVLANNHKNVVSGQRGGINKTNQKSILTTPTTPPVNSKVLAATQQPSISIATTKTASAKQ